MRGGRLWIIGLVGAALLGSATAHAHAQDADSRYLVNPNLIAPDGLGGSSSNATEELALGYTLSGYNGVVGQLELGRATLGHHNVTYPAYDFISPRTTESEANIQWNVSPRLTVASAFRRETSDPRFSPTQYTQDTFGGGVALAITPRLRVTASGSVSLRAEDGAETYTTLSGDSAQLGAAYSFTPGLRGAVNYTYQSYDGGEGSLESEDEATLSLSVTSSF